MGIINTAMELIAQLASDPDSEAAQKVLAQARLIYAKHDFDNFFPTHPSDDVSRIKALRAVFPKLNSVQRDWLEKLERFTDLNGKVLSEKQRKIVSDIEADVLQ